MKFINNFSVCQGTSHCQQTDAKDREETEGGDDTGRGREKTCRPVQRTGTTIIDCISKGQPQEDTQNSTARHRALNNHLMGVRSA